VVIAHSHIILALEYKYRMRRNRTGSLREEREKKIYQPVRGPPGWTTKKGYIDSRI